MSEFSSRRFRRHALAAATALVLCTAIATPALAQGRVNTAALQSAQEFDRFIVKYRDGSAERTDTVTLGQTLRAAAGAMSARSRALDLRHVRRMALGADVVKTDRKLDRAEAETLMRQLAANPNVEYVEVDRLLKPVFTPNDTRYGEQWGYFDADAGIRANTAWDLSNGSGMIVAVLDTGITSHSDLSANVVAGYDFISDTFVSRDGNGRDSDASDPGDWYTAGECGAGTPGSNSSWHGTHVAGTVGAVTNNAKGVAGTAFGAKVMPVRVLGRCGGYTSDIADAIIWSSGGSVTGVPTLSAANAADVINLSLGGPGACDTTTQNAINSAVGRGTVVVVAAGNDNADAANFSPASCNNVITVASVTSASSRSSFSNYGAKIDVAAPGSSILSTLNSGTTTPSTESYAAYNGTSMAAPHVAGTVALVQSRRVALGLTPLTPASVETLLKNTAYALAGSCSGGCGAGIVDARRAVENAGGTGGGGSQTYTNGTDVQIRDNTTVESSIAVSGRSGNAPSSTPVAVDIRHTYRGDLVIDLVAPDGSLYRLKNSSSSDSADNVITTYNVNLSTETINGTWRLRVRDVYSGDTGYINSWSITF
ncbi:MAG TPA: S8 family serine peptidase [Lysobacter sp.]|nr:S8 family serine peptidase [Lysobacter sp.]